jgi:hypothetical protein
VDLGQNSVYEQPDSGIFIGTVADVVELYGIKTKFGDKNKVRIVWILDKNNSQGKPYHAVLQKNATMHEKGDLFKAVRAILGTNPPITQNTEQLASLIIGKANQLFIMKEKNEQGKEFSNIKGINALPPGAVVPAIPADFVRAKDKKQFVPGQAVGNTAAPTPFTQPAPQSTAASFGASAPAPVAVQAKAQYTPPPPPAAQSTNATF